MLRAVVSGSFHRHMGAITAAVHELASRSVRVLSPADPRVVAAQGEFLFVASDRVRSVRLVQDRHLECIRAADFVWLICPDGYVGQSASMELGYAAAAGTPIFATHAPVDLTLKEYVTVVRNLTEALRRSCASRRVVRENILIDPHPSLEKAHDTLNRIADAFAERRPAEYLYKDVADLQATLALPAYMQ